MVGAEEPHRLFHRHGGWQGAGLELHADRLHAALLGSDAHLAGVGLAQALDALKRRRLPRSVGAKQSEDLAREHVEADSVRGDSRAVGLGQATHAEHDSAPHRQLPSIALAAA